MADQKPLLLPGLVPHLFNLQSRAAASRRRLSYRISAMGDSAAPAAATPENVDTVNSQAQLLQAERDARAAGRAPREAAQHQREETRHARAAALEEARDMRAAAREEARDMRAAAREEARDVREAARTREFCVWITVVVISCGGGASRDEKGFVSSKICFFEVPHPTLPHPLIDWHRTLHPPAISSLFPVVAFLVSLLHSSSFIHSSSSSSFAHLTLVLFFSQDFDDA
ncbi:hypothetical protein B0H16DRAFT_1785286 [Mycena metata]|uniref:Uncharacterized protein n=1 Tax=Mycena metata TaxID=1033252 RepID=A0AAD7JQC6_9AGAR|nr:hypothetical protein B0H16DRAFT_1785286 [Mycena metata]